MLVVKLGGSYITHKRGYSSIKLEWNETDRSYPVKRNILAGCARALRRHMDNGLIIVHGGGIHGHRTVLRWRDGIAKGPQVMMPWDVRRRMDELTAEVVSVLGKGGIPAFPVPPGNIMSADSSTIAEIDLTPINSALERGMVPVLRGDLVPDVSGGWSVVSGDEIIARIGALSHLSQLPPIERVIMLMEADGFFEGGATLLESRLPIIDDMKFHDRFDKWVEIGRTSSSDVSGGIIKKLRTAHRLAANGISVSLIGGDPNRINSVIVGEDVGTTFQPFEGKNECLRGICVNPGV